MARLGRPPYFTKAQRLEVFERFGAIVCCQAPGCDNAIYIKECPIDHWQPWIFGGEHNFTNWRPICTSCHRKKSNRELQDIAKAKRIAAKNGQSFEPRIYKPSRKGKSHAYVTAPVSERFKENYRVVPSGCWLWLGGLDNFGYGRFRMPGAARTTSHRASWLLHQGDIPDGMMVLHKCDVASCVNPEHLYIGTYADNMNDIMRRRRSGLAKITAEQALAIREDTRDWREIAAEYGLKRQTIWDIRHGMKWKDHQMPDALRERARKIQSRPFPKRIRKKKPNPLDALTEISSK